MYNIPLRGCACPSEKPNYVNGVCQGCEAPLVWSSATNSCVKCSEGTHYLID